VETLVLFVLTIFIGFLLSSAALFAVCSLHSVMRQVIFYPVWLALIILAGLFGISVLCGLAPIWSLLRRTPAEILSKYDV
jgi:ABC-type antimicrobial peptide transport system permease subunit